MKRKERDISKLKSSGFSVHREEFNENEIVVEFLGPSDTPYHQGMWKVII